MEREYQREEVDRYATPKPDSYLVWAILSTLFCCLPFGIVAIVYATRVDSYYVAGRYEESLQASRLAKRWTIASVFTFVGLTVLYVILVVALGVTAGALEGFFE